MMGLVLQYDGLSRVISGGQCGVDQGALLAASELGVLTGGTAPKGWRTYYGPAPILKALRLSEDTSSDYKPRTLANIRNSDATLIIARDLDSPGTKLTYQLCISEDKPVFRINLANIEPGEIDNIIENAAIFIINNKVRCINVAGNRDSRESTDMFYACRSIMRGLLITLNDRNLLILDTDF